MMDLHLKAIGIFDGKAWCVLTAHSDAGQTALQAWCETRNTVSSIHAPSAEASAWCEQQIERGLRIRYN